MALLHIGMYLWETSDHRSEWVRLQRHNLSKVFNELLALNMITVTVHASAACSVNVQHWWFDSQVRSRIGL